MGDGFFSFALVSGAHIENVLAHRLVQYHAAGRRGHLGDVAFLKQGDHALCVRRSPRQEQGGYIIFFNQFARVFLRKLRLKLVIKGDQFNLLSMYAALALMASR